MDSSLAFTLPFKLMLYEIITCKEDEEIVLLQP